MKPLKVLGIVILIALFALFWRFTHLKPTIWPREKEQPTQPNQTDLQEYEQTVPLEEQKG